jgi:hypothetical protein
MEEEDNKKVKWARYTHTQDKGGRNKTGPVDCDIDPAGVFPNRGTHRVK